MTKTADTSTTLAMSAAPRHSAYAVISHNTVSASSLPATVDAATQRVTDTVFVAPDNEFDVTPNVLTTADDDDDDDALSILRAACSISKASLSTATTTVLSYNYHAVILTRSQ